MWVSVAFCDGLCHVEISGPLLLYIVTFFCVWKSVALNSLRKETYQQCLWWVSCEGFLWVPFDPCDLQRLRARVLSLSCARGLSLSSQGLATTLTLHYTKLNSSKPNSTKPNYSVCALESCLSLRKVLQAASSGVEVKGAGEGRERGRGVGEGVAAAATTTAKGSVIVEENEEEETEAGVEEETRVCRPRY